MNNLVYASIGLMLVWTCVMSYYFNSITYGVDGDLWYYEQQDYLDADLYHYAGLMLYSIIGFEGAILLIFGLMPLILFDLVRQVKGFSFAVQYYVFIMFGTIVPYYFARQFVFSQVTWTFIILTLAWVVVSANNVLNGKYTEFKGFPTAS
jgi:hypothetical protein